MKTFITLTLLFIACVAHAQDGTPVGDALTGNSKLNVVVAVVGVIVLGIGIWMFAMDRKLSRMEKRMDK
ncbi:MAG: hypothetical protein IPL52_08785 [Flavobacteriales bacterium]|nr:hypothetical protein [Flavobacteriales bacterium]